MVVPRVDGAMAGRIANAIGELRIAEPSAADKIEPAAASLAGANDLLAFFVSEAAQGEPKVCTYGWAYRTLFSASYAKFSMAYARKAIQLACCTSPRHLPGLGLVRLDAFIVSKKDGFPSDGYWPVAHHDREEWNRVLGSAEILD